MKILIVGSSGFLGRNLIDKISHNHEIICYDKKKLSRKYINKKNIKKIFHNSIRSDDMVRSAAKDVDVIFYRLGILGGQESVKIDNAKRFLQINYEYLIKFLRIIETQNVKKFIFDSSEQALGEKTKQSKNQNYTEPYPLNYYGLSKLMCEKFLLDWQKENKTAIDIFRYPRVMDKSNSGVINAMINSCINKRKIIIDDDPNRKLTFLHINDAIDANLKSLNKLSTQSRILNLSNNQFISIRELAKKIIRKTKVKCKLIIKKDLSKNNFQPLNANMRSDETIKILNWKPKYSLDDIIDEKISFLKGKTK